MPLSGITVQPEFSAIESPSRRRLGLFGWAVFFALAAGECVVAQAQAAPLDPGSVERIKTELKDIGIQPTAEGLGEYLKDLHPSSETAARMKKLISDLGDEDFYRREAAMTELLRLPVHSPQIFQKAIDAGDAEIRWRAKQVLKLGNSRTERVLHSAFQLIRQEKMAGLFAPVLDAIPFCTETYIREEALKTLKTIATAEDVPMIQAALNRSDQPTREIAIATLEHVVKGDADPDLMPFLKSDDQSLRLAAARALLNHGRRGALPMLVDLLNADDLDIRARTAETLRLATGQNFSFVAYDTVSRRGVAHSKWVNWVANNATTAKLNFPIPDGPITRQHTLICNYSLKKVVELDANHKEVWSTELDGAWGCQGLSNGHRLVTSYSQRSIIEYDTAGKKIWEKNQLPGLPYSVERLGNGNTLVTCSNNQVLEYSPDGKMAWQHQLTGTPRDAQRLGNGNTLVVLYSTQQIVELDRKGKEVWKLENMQRPLCAQRLDNGNTLICQLSGRRLVEVDRKGDEVWSQNMNFSVYDAQRLPNGNTLVVGATGAVEFDRQGQTVWQRNEPGMRGIHRF